MAGMALRVALRSLAAQPVRTAVLACGFGSGIAAMAGLLGIGEVILEQSRSPQLAGGGDVMIVGGTGDVANARYLLSAVLAAPPHADRVRVAAPSISETLYLVEPGREPLRVFARAGVPSLERALGDSETAGIAAWQDTPADRAWAAVDPGEVLRAMDRFRAAPPRAAEDDSWAEWLYFNGRAADASFYLTFLVGGPAPGGRRAGVRLQLERGGRMEVFSTEATLSDHDVVERAPDLRIGDNEVQLDGLRYRIRLALPGLTGDLELEAVPGRSIPPFQVRGARGWITGYVVPVLSGPLSGALTLADGTRVDFAGATGYHDHNWGFWRGVAWRWGQVAGEDLSFVYGRIAPPADAVDPARLPGLLVALDARGPVAFTTGITIEEVDDPVTGAPREITVRGSGGALDVTLRLAIESVTRTRLGLVQPGEDTDFLQMRAAYRVSGEVGGRPVDFAARGSAETFRSRPPAP